MNIAIITLYNNGNYGASLQAYALNRVVRSLAHECVTVKYKRTFPNSSSNPNHFTSKLRTVMDKPSLLLSLPALIIMKRVLKHDYQIRQGRFDEFESKNIPQTSKSYIGSKDVSSIVNDYDAFICGSDNIWNRAAFDPAMMLDFVPINKLKVSYAAGFSTDTLTQSQKESMLDLIGALDAISVRESNGRDLLECLLGRKVTLSPDPTLLLTKEQWMEVSEPVQALPKKYIFCYFMGKQRESREYALNLSKKLSLPIVTLPHIRDYIKADKHFGDVRSFNIGPGEFITCVANAEYIVTDAFHGTIFAILFEKPFLSFNRFFTKVKNELNFRLVNLFNLLGIPNRVVTDNASYKRVVSETVDYASVKEKLCQLRQEANDYLTDTLSLIDKKQE